MKILSLLLLLLFTGLQYSIAQNQKIKQEKLTNFDLQSTELIHSSGETISTTAYRSNVYWFPV